MTVEESEESEESTQWLGWKAGLDFQPQPGMKCRAETYMSSFQRDIYRTTLTKQLLFPPPTRTHLLDTMHSTVTTSTIAKFFALLGLKTGQPSRSIASSSSRADLGPPREMGYMVNDYSQAIAYISLEKAQNSRTVALRSMNLTQTSGTLDLTMLHNEQSWPSVYGLVSLEEAQNNKLIARRAIYLL